MTDTDDTPKPAPEGERIAKVMARAGVASRRDAERLILEGRVQVNGQTVTSPALDVRPADTVTLDGKPIDAPQPTRLWLYYKPLGLVTSEHDEKGRQTVFESLPDGMPRVMSVGRLDLNSEGLLLLTNDGELKRRLELPATGWLRKYRVRVNGRPTEAMLEPLRQGVTIDGEEFLPMEVTLDRQQGANAWLTVGLREGRNREIRRAMTEIGLFVNRLIRVSYGPFRLNVMQPGDVVEVKARILREQLGPLLPGYVPPEEKRAPRKPRTGKSQDAAPCGPRADGDAPRKPRAEGFKPRSEGFKSHKPRTEGDAPRRPRADGDGPRKPRSEGFKSHGPRAEGDAPRKPRAEGFKPRAEGFKSHKPRTEGDAPGKSGGGDRPRKPRSEGFKSHGPRAEGDAPRKPRAEGFKPRAEGFKAHKPRTEGDAPGKTGGGKPRGPRPEGAGPRPPRGGGKPGPRGVPGRKPKP
ncbi:MAG: pseudouridine synthase [Pseudomonadota bacterium]